MRKNKIWELMKILRKGERRQRQKEKGYFSPLPLFFGYFSYACGIPIFLSFIEPLTVLKTVSFSSPLRHVQFIFFALLYWVPSSYFTMNSLCWFIGHAKYHRWKTWTHLSDLMKTVISISSSLILLIINCIKANCWFESCFQSRSRSSLSPFRKSKKNKTIKFAISSWIEMWNV